MVSLSELINAGRFIPEPVTSTEAVNGVVARQNARARTEQLQAATQNINLRNDRIRQDNILRETLGEFYQKQIEQGIDPTSEQTLIGAGEIYNEFGRGDKTQQIFQEVQDRRDRQRAREDKQAQRQQSAIVSSGNFGNPVAVATQMQGLGLIPEGFDTSSVARAPKTSTRTVSGQGLFGITTDPVSGQFSTQLLQPSASRGGPSQGNPDDDYTKLLDAPKSFITSVEVDEETGTLIPFIATARTKGDLRDMRANAIQSGFTEISGDNVNAALKKRNLNVEDYENITPEVFDAGDALLQLAQIDEEIATEDEQELRNETLAPKREQQAQQKQKQQEEAQKAQNVDDKNAFFSLFGDFAQGLNSGLRGVESSVGEFAADTLGFEDNATIARGNQATAEANIPNSRAGRVGAITGSTIPTSAALAGLTAINPALGAVGLFGVSANEGINKAAEVRDRGGSTTAQVLSGLGAGALEFGTEAIPLFKANRFITKLGADILGENLVTQGDLLIDQATGEKVSLKDRIDAGVVTTLASTITGGIQAGALTAADRGARRQTPGPTIEDAKANLEPTPAVQRTYEQFVSDALADPILEARADIATDTLLRTGQPVPERADLLLQLKKTDGLLTPDTKLPDNGIKLFDSRGNVVIGNSDTVEEAGLIAFGDVVERTFGSKAKEGFLESLDRDSGKAKTPNTSQKGAVGANIALDPDSMALQEVKERLSITQSDEDSFFGVARNVSGTDVDTLLNIGRGAKSLVRNQFTYPQTVMETFADKHPGIVPAYTNAIKSYRIRSEYLFDATSRLRPYMDIHKANPKVANKAFQKTMNLQEAIHNDPTIQFENEVDWYKNVANYSEAEAVAAKSMVDTTFFALDRLEGQDVSLKTRAAQSKKKAITQEYIRKSRETQTPEQQDTLDKTYSQELGKIDNALSKFQNVITRTVGELKKSPYIPRTRDGENVVTAFDVNGDVVSFSGYETEIEAERAAVKLQKKYDSEGNGVVVSADRKRTDFLSTSPYGQTPLSLIERIAVAEKESGINEALGTQKDSALEYYKQLSGGKDPKPSGFKAHFTKRNFVDGFDTDSMKVMSRYNMRAANFITNREVQYGLDEFIESLPNDSGLKKFTVDYRNSIVASPSSPVARKIKGLVYAHHLTFRFSSVVTNMTQPITVTYPQVYLLRKEQGLGHSIAFSGAAKEVVVSQGKAVSYMMNKKRFQKKNPELYNALQVAERSGVFGNSTLDEVYEKGQEATGPIEKGLKAFNRFGFVPFGVAERFNRIGAFIAAYRNTPKIKNQDAKITKALDFVDTTQFNYGRAAKPAIGRNKFTEHAFMFRNWHGNFLKLMKNALGEKEFGTFARHWGGMIGVAGLASSLPGSREILSIANSLGFDPELWAKEKLDDVLPTELSYIALYGLPNILGVDMSASAGINSNLPLDDLSERGMAYSLGRTLMGASGAIPEQTYRMYKQIQQGATQRGLLEENPLFPTAFRRPVRAYREATEGMSSFDGTPILDERGQKVKITGLDAAKSALGFNPSSRAAISKARSAQFRESQNNKRKSESKRTKNLKAARILLEQGNTAAYQFVKENPELDMKKVRDKAKQLRTGVRSSSSKKERELDKSLKQRFQFNGGLF